MTDKKQLDPSLVNFIPPRFSVALLHPKHWGVWLGFGYLALLVNILPYRLLYWLGRGMGRIGQKIAKKRALIALRNLELAFPDMDAKQRQHIVDENFKNTGFALFESAMAWFWPNWRLKNIVNFHDLERLSEVENRGQGILFCGVHALNVELTARCCALKSPGYGVYRPHKNPAYNFIQHWGRTRLGNIMVDRKDVKGMLKVLKKGEKLFYLPDHDYGFRNAVFVPFFAVKEASTTMGTSVLVDASKCAVLPVSCFRNGFKYDFMIKEDISAQFPKRDAITTATVMNQAIEKLIEGNIEQWMWVHKRYKTMPDDQNKGIRYQ